MIDRLLITGSRDWDDVLRIQHELLKWFNPTTVLISGHCPTGADNICERIWTRLGGTVETHPAQWATYGKRAGFVRNAEMVDSGPDICLAFIRNGSKGATMTADLADKAGIPTYRYTIR